MSQLTQVREIELKEIALLAELEKKIFSDPWSEGSLQSTYESVHGSIMVCDGGIEGLLGYIIYYCVGDEIELARIATIPEARGMGMGAYLMRELEYIAAQEKKERVLLEVRASNRHAIKFYHKFGFTSIGMRKSYYTNPIEDGNIMEKVL